VWKAPQVRLPVVRIAHTGESINHSESEAKLSNAIGNGDDLEKLHEYLTIYPEGVIAAMAREQLCKWAVWSRHQFFHGLPIVYDAGKFSRRKGSKAMILCNQCGNEVAADSATCTVCGVQTAADISRATENVNSHFSSQPSATLPVPKVEAARTKNLLSQFTWS